MVTAPRNKRKKYPVNTVNKEGPLILINDDLFVLKITQLIDWRNFQREFRDIVFFFAYQFSFHEVNNSFIWCKHNTWKVIIRKRILSKKKKDKEFVIMT